MTRTASAIALALLALLPSGSLAAQGRDLTPYLIPDPATEIALARTAAPKHVSDSATVYVLTRDGYVEAVRGSNDFTCVVVRSFVQDPRLPHAWEPRGRAPHCFNADATRSIFAEFKHRSRLAISGATPDRIVAEMDQAHRRGAFPAPGATAMAYMQSRSQWLFAEDPDWHPHVMFYYPRSTEVGIFGATQDFTVPVIDGSDTYLPFKVLLIPVPHWSDGTPESAGHGH